jgi:hypothetical protein
VFTGAQSEPQFGAPAAVAGEIGVELVIQNGAPTGYIITAAGTAGNILTTLNNGQ